MLQYLIIWNSTHSHVFHVLQGIQAVHKNLLELVVELLGPGFIARTHYGSHVLEILLLVVCGNMCCVVSLLPFGRVVSLDSGTSSHELFEPFLSDELLASLRGRALGCSASFSHGGARVVL
jgi:hypothetical protein